ncbi:MAG: hypothetical protein WC733_06290 [Methylophilus sp.]|jgi:hypothetical protein
MVDKIKEFFAALAKVHAVTYMIVIGLFTSVLYVYIAEPQVHKIWLKRIGYAGVFAMLFYTFITRCFYEKYELGRKYLPTTNSGWVIRDTYFLTKINSNITRLQKISGYLYVVFRIVHAGYLGFLLGLVPLLCVKHALGFKAW